MSKVYIMRMDDACPTMHWDMWDPLEEAFDRLGIKPIVGVIPDNQDPTMLYTSPNPDFWERVRAWQNKGWGIALHGLHHAYHKIPETTRAIMPINSGQSEFVGLDLAQQCAMIKKSWQIFLDNGVKPALFMAPSHTFDENTLRALLQETDIRTITDGYALFPYEDQGFSWIPQQLGSVTWLPYLPFGVWTVCLHPNMMDAEELAEVLTQLPNLASKSVPFETAGMRYGHAKKIMADRVFASIFTIIIKIKRQILASIKPSRS